MAGGGIKQGFTFGETDDLGYNVVKDRVHVHDLQATILHLLGLDHTRLTYKFQGRNFRLTDVHGEVVKGIDVKRMNAGSSLKSALQKYEAVLARNLTF